MRLYLTSFRPLLDQATRLERRSVKSAFSIFGLVLIICLAMIALSGCRSKRSGTSLNDAEGISGAEASSGGEGTPSGGVQTPPPSWPEQVRLLTLVEGRAELIIDLSEGQELGLPEWGRGSDIGCWEGVTQSFWSGKTQLFALSEPLQPWQRVTLTLTPEEDVDVNLFAYLQAHSLRGVPPEVEAVDLCLTSFEPSSLGNAGVAESVTFTLYNAPSPQELVFGAAYGVEGAVTLSVEVTDEDPDNACLMPLQDPNDWAPHVRVLSLDESGEAIVRGDLSMGARMCTLDWVESSFCDPLTQEIYYQGNHQLFAFPQSPYSLQTVSVTPDPGVELSVYGLWQGATRFETPPRSTFGGCDVSHPYSLSFTPNPGEVESLSFVALNNPYNNLIGVVGYGPEGTEGAFTVRVKEVSTRENECEESDYLRDLEEWPSAVQQITLDDTGEATLRGDLSGGRPLCTLEWANTASTACFPETLNDYFHGNHVFYALQDPLAAGSSLEVTVHPDPEVEVSVYGYWMNPQTYDIPPYLPGVGSCDADYARAGIAHTPNFGAPEHLRFSNPTNNRYNYFFGVAGFSSERYPNIGTSGAYTVNVRVVDAPPAHCVESLPGSTYPAWPGHVEQVTLTADQSDSTRYLGTATGSLSEGACVHLDFATESYCFPATQDQHFEGNHVFYALADPMPPHSELTVTVTPEPDVEVSLYGYDMSATRYDVPPRVRQVVRCEASYTQQGVTHTPNPGEPERIHFSNPTDNEYNVLLGVAGDRETGTTGDFTLSAELLTARVHCEESLSEMGYDDWPSSVRTISMDARDEVSFTDDLARGQCTHLGFAARSDVACFPATQNQHFEGNHVFYALEEEMPPNSTISISVIPDSDVEVNLYGWQDGVDEFNVPPHVEGVVSCEASLPRAGVSHTPNPGAVESIRFYNPSTNPNAYQVFFAVAGDRDTGTSGQYSVLINMDQSQTHCSESLPGDRYETWPDEVERLSISGGQVTISGDLSSGACVNLEWASNSSVACFPTTAEPYFQGDVRYFTLDRALLSSEQVTLTLSSTSTAQVGLFAYLIDDRAYYVPPFVPAVATCEASYGGAAGTEARLELYNRGGEAHHLLIGVAGHRDDPSGSFELTATVDEAP